VLILATSIVLGREETRKTALLMVQEQGDVWIEFHRMRCEHYDEGTQGQRRSPKNIQSGASQNTS
jgi:hypothetical protein